MGSAVSLSFIIGSSIVGVAFIIVVIILLKIFIGPKKDVALKRYIENRNFPAAISLAREILLKDNTHIEAHFYLAEAYFQRKNYDLALPEFNIVEKSGVYDKIDQQLLRERLAELHEERDDLESALTEYILLTQIYINNHFYFYKAAQICEKIKKTPMAIDFYTKSIKLNKKFIPAQLEFGILLFTINKKKTALKLFDSVLKQDAFNVPANYYKAVLEIDAGNYADALKHLDKTITSREYGNRCLMQKGRIYINQRKYKLALRELKKSLRNLNEEKDDKLEILYLMGDAYEKLRDIPEAIKHWEEILQAKPKYKDVLDRLENFKGTATNKRLKKFFMAQEEDFVEMCKGILIKLAYKILDYQQLSTNKIEFTCFEHDEKMKNLRKKPVLVCFFRRTDPIQEAEVRMFHDRMREKKMMKSLLIAPTTYTTDALEFVKERSVDLVGQDRLNELLSDL